MEKIIAKLGSKALFGKHLKPAEITPILKLDWRRPEIYDLLYWANKIRYEFYGNRIKKCSIVNIKSGRCGEDCQFCSQSVRHRAKIEVYPLVREDVMVQASRQAKAWGSTLGLVAAWNKPGRRDFDRILSAGRRISSRRPVHASLGALTPEMARALKKAGFTMYHHNLETSRSFFPRIVSTHSYEDKLKTIAVAKQAGLQVCSGGILGMGESWKQRAELALALRDLRVDSVPINFLNPVPGTPLGNRKPMPPLEALQCLALFRFIYPQGDIRVAGGREITLGDLQSWIFYAGANGVMVGNYLTTPGRGAELDNRMIENLGMRGIACES